MPGLKAVILTKKEAHSGFYNVRVGVVYYEKLNLLYDTFASFIKGKVDFIRFTIQLLYVASFSIIFQCVFYNVLHRGPELAKFKISALAATAIKSLA